MICHLAPHVMRCWRLLCGWWTLCDRGGGSADHRYGLSGFEPREDVVDPQLALMTRSAHADQAPKEAFNLSAAEGGWSFRPRRRPRVSA